MALTQNANVGKLNQTTTSTSFIVPTPTGFAAGDVLYCVLNVDSKSVTVTAPSGWTLDQDISTSLALGNRTRTYWKVADGTEGASQTWTISAAQRGSGTMLGFSGADTVAPVNAHATQNNSTSSPSQVAPSVTPTVTGGILVCSMSAFINGSYTPPSGMTEQSDQANVDTTTSVATLTGMTTAATGTKTFTASTSSGSIATSAVIVPAQTVSASVPVGTANGDLLFAQVYANNQPATTLTLPAAVLPAGWTQIDSLSVLAGAPNYRLTTAYRIAASEPASYTFGVDGSTAANAFIRTYAGPWAASPLDVHGTQQNSFTTSASVGSVTVSTANSLALMSIGQGGGSIAISAMPSGFSAGANGTAGSSRHDVLENAAIAAGATGTLTATMASAVSNVVFIAVFTPGAGGTTVVAPVMTGSGAMPAPTPTIALAAPVLTGSGLLPTPTPVLRLSAPALAGSGLLPAPSLAFVSNPTILAPVLAGSGLLPAPVIAAGIVIAAPVLTGSGQLLPGLPALRLAAPALAGSGLLPAGTPVLTLGAPVLSGSGVLPAPLLSLSPTISAPVLSGSGALLPGTPGLTLSAPVLAGSGSILNGSIALSQVILAPVLRGSGLLPVPQLVILTPLPGWGIMQGREPFSVIADASLHGAAVQDAQAFGLIVALDPSGVINKGEPFALIVDVSPRGKG